MKALRIIGIVLLGLASLFAYAWAFGALWYDGPFKAFAVLNAIGVPLLIFFVKSWRNKIAAFCVWFALVIVWWLSLSPPTEGNWQPDVAKLPRAEINGDVITLHNVRNFDYQGESNFTPRWETRTLRISQLTGIDIAINYWGSPWMAHPIISFQFADAPPLCFSIETRKKMGQSYSAIGGLYRQYSLIYIAADERDVLRVRTNFRKGEDVYLYRLKLTPEQARTRLLEYIDSINSLQDKPRWYNAITTNCTTAIRHQHVRHSSDIPPWDWRMLVNGKGDELMFERGYIETNGLSFTELKQRSHANKDAVAAGDSSEFSRLIRLQRPGMAAKK